MAVTLPPWLNIDPIAPARIRLQANQQRNQAAASERAAQAQAQDLQFRRERAAAQDAQESEKEAAQERSALRRDQVLRQTNDQELAIAAQQMQMRREVEAQKAQQFQQTLRLKQQSAEAEAKSAAKQMQGMQAVQRGLKEGKPLQQLISENAPDLFAKHPERMPSAVPRAAPRGVEGPPTMINVKDESGQPTGIMAIPGRGGVNVQKSQGLSARDRLMADRAQLGYIMSQLTLAPGAEEEAKLKADAKVIQERLRNYAMPPAPAAVAPGLLPARPAAPAPSQAPVDEADDEDEEPESNDSVRVRSPDGKMGTIPADQLAEALKDGYEEIESQV